MCNSIARILSKTVHNYFNVKITIVLVVNSLIYSWGLDLEILGFLT